MPANKTIAIIGSGAVGASIASALILRNVSSTVLMVDIDDKVAEGQTLDLTDSLFLSSSHVKVGTYKEAGQADIIVITAGANQKPGETRLQLIEKNCTILQSVITRMSPINPSSKILLVANPVDILAHITQRISGLPHRQVFGSGTFLDSGRLRSVLARKLGVSDVAIHCYVLGEHGDNQFVAWSSASVGGVPLLEFPQMENIDREALAKEVRRKAYEIIELKGATYYGIGACVSSLCESMLYHRCDVRPVSCWNEKYQCYVSVPAVIGMNGIEDIIDIRLNEEETKNMAKAVDAMRQAVGQYI
ncbi:L-lactate dehydrogenase [Basidiobolus meristosporus CBS 931.73]|uniref:L-lactate dehydrogenase n=1 Tax=Basidiobolus meristosporus CBS 931.73 TaxID=1314790 RepID=A0A1Y1XGQ4_9FUNG|nr:L-lactate dehydrogenase [Basidiobolus meristosporus CBS 931.73]|eukprot:ORX84917.1 L-lactate dehydrogenase [Basidiobolus meristosporus CBS 931.73]